MLKKTLLTILAALLLNLASAAPARAGAARDADSVRKVKEAVERLGMGVEARVEVKLKGGAKLKGYVAEASGEDFAVVDSAGKTTRVAYADVERVKAVKPKSARKKFDEKGLIGLSLIGGIFVLAFLVASGTK